MIIYGTDQAGEYELVVSECVDKFVVIVLSGKENEFVVSPVKIHPLLIIQGYVFCF